ncbi:MAG: cytochrome c maturation protein CcmE [Candidatus Bathyarchaeota archaeon]|nr:MAG: cytochrome c maturation protein CcmE [Candidatus Bathyarchaeota archaeon]
MKIQGKYLVVGVLLLLSAGLAFDSMTNYLNPYLSVTHVAANTDRYEGRSIQVMGVIAIGSIVRGGEGTTIFAVTDGDETLDVTYVGALPQNFDQGKDVVVVGSLRGGESLEASKILMKCPSKYESGSAPLLGNHVFWVALAMALVAVAYLVITVAWKRG